MSIAKSTTTTTAAAAPLEPSATRTPRQVRATKPVAAKKGVVKKAGAPGTASKKTISAKALLAPVTVRKPSGKTPRPGTVVNPEAQSGIKKTGATSEAVMSGKARKPKLVRDSFTMPKVEYVVLEALKQRAGRLNRPMKKSELLRAGIKALAAMQDAVFLTALDKVPAIKTARPVADK